jgi:hypothetical protein
MIFSTLALYSSAVIAAPTSPLSKSIHVKGKIEIVCSRIRLSETKIRYNWVLTELRLENSEKSFELRYSYGKPAEDNKFSLPGHDLAIHNGITFVQVDGKAVSLSQALSKPEDIHSPKKIIDSAMLNTTFDKMLLPECTEVSERVGYSQPIEGELKIGNLL